MGKKAGGGRGNGGNVNLRNRIEGFGNSEMPPPVAENFEDRLHQTLSQDETFGDWYNAARASVDSMVTAFDDTVNAIADSIEDTIEAVIGDDDAWPTDVPQGQTGTNRGPSKRKSEKDDGERSGVKWEEVVAKICDEGDLDSFVMRIRTECVNAAEEREVAGFLAEQLNTADKSSHVLRILYVMQAVEEGDLPVCMDVIREKSQAKLEKCKTSTLSRALATQVYGDGPSPKTEEQREEEENGWQLEKKGGPKEADSSSSSDDSDKAAKKAKKKEKKALKKEKFGFSVGDKVTWTGADHDVPTGTIGKVVNFSGERVAVQFPKGTRELLPGRIAKAENKAKAAPKTVDLLDVTTAAEPAKAAPNVDLLDSSPAAPASGLDLLDMAAPAAASTGPLDLLSLGTTATPTLQPINAPAPAPAASSVAVVRPTPAAASSTSASASLFPGLAPPPPASAGLLAFPGMVAAPQQQNAGQWNAFQTGSASAGLGSRGMQDLFQSNTSQPFGSAGASAPASGYQSAFGSLSLGAPADSFNPNQKSSGPMIEVTRGAAAGALGSSSSQTSEARDPLAGLNPFASSSPNGQLGAPMGQLQGASALPMGAGARGLQPAKPAQATAKADPFQLDDILSAEFAKMGKA